MSLARRTGTTRLSSTIGPRHVSFPLVQLNAVRRLPVSCTYTSKAKAKSTASFVPGSQHLFESEEARAECAKAESKMAVDWFRKEVAAFETTFSPRTAPLAVKASLAVSFNVIVSGSEQRWPAVQAPKVNDHDLNQGRSVY